MRNVKAIAFIIIGVALFTYVLISERNKPGEVQIIESVLPSGEEQIVEDAGFTLPPEFIDPDENRIIIDKIGVDAKIWEGGEEILALGVWHLPRTSNPELGGNTVISAHRWKYKPPDPRTFYDLDKLELDDEIKINWQGIQYIYKVRDIFVVTPDKIEILGPSETAELTLFTCTPLYSTAKRLIIKADLETSTSTEI